MLRVPLKRYSGVLLPNHPQFRVRVSGDAQIIPGNGEFSRFVSRNRLEIKARSISAAYAIFSFVSLVRGHILVSNFNNGQNLKGTGTTIVDIAPDGTLSVFAQIVSFPRAGCGKSACPVVCPAKAGMFSRR